MCMNGLCGGHNMQMLPTDSLTILWAPRRFQTQMQYGSIGWSVGACLGCAVGSRYHKQRLLLFVGDGCFQIGAQVMSQDPFQWSQHPNLSGAQLLLRCAALPSGHTVQFRQCRA